MRRLKEANIRVKDVRKVDLKICVCYPGEYRVGMSNLALHILYGLLNSVEWVACERAFYEGGPPLTLENRLSLKNFDVLFFTLQYEMDLPYVLSMLMESGVPVYANDRGAEHPLIIGGGPLVVQNPTPFMEFFDALFIGEVEEIALKLLEALLLVKRRSRDLTPLLDVEGMLLPRVNEGRVNRVYVKDLDKAFYPSMQVIPLSEEPVFGKAFLLESGRGCGWGCRFCMAGYTYRPPRFRSLRKVEEILEEGQVDKLYDKVAVISLAAADHPGFKDILAALRDRGLNYSVPSLRLEKVDAELIELLKEGGQRTFTVAPEVAGEELSRRINKNISPEDVLALASEAYRKGFKNIKLYFMIGLPGEKDEDVIAISQLLENVLKEGFSSVRVTITPFVPKPQTPLQWFPQEPLRSLRRKIRLVLRHVKHKERVLIKIYNPKRALIEAVIARGDSRLSKALLRVAASKDFGLASWRKALKSVLADPESEANKQLPLDSKQPWEVINVGVSKGFLRSEYEKYLRGEETPPCYVRCCSCGVCC